MSAFYLLGIRIIYILIAIASLFNSKARFWIKGRKKLLQRIKSDISKDEKIAWFHCASLGEFEQGRPVIESFKLKYPGFKICLTFYSPSGFEIRKNYEQADYIYYLPIDTPGNAKKLVEYINPDVVFFVKYEFWYFILREISKNNIPLYLISGIFRKEQRFFRSNGWSRKILNFFTYFFVQNEESKQLLNSINLENVIVSGDTRFDRVSEIAKQAKELELVEKFKEHSLVMVAGSTWKPDEELIIKYINETEKELKLIIAPHEIHKENISRLQNAFKQELTVLKYSQANENNIQSAQILIIDSIGLLSSLYKYGRFAYIGGGFGKGIHNTLEAATFGLPIIFGPNYLKFQEAVDLAEIGSAFPIKSHQNFKETLDVLFNEEDKVDKLGEKSSEYVIKNCGATNKILELIHTGKK